MSWWIWRISSQNHLAETEEDLDEIPFFKPFWDPDEGVCDPFFTQSSVPRPLSLI